MYRPTMLLKSIEIMETFRGGTLSENDLLCGVQYV